MQKIGIDVGGVILEYDTHFSSKRETNPKFVENSLETISELNTKYELFIISYCNEITETKIRSILKNSKIQIPENKWIFTRTKSEKADVCLQYSIDLLIDDTYQVHQALFCKCPFVKRVWFNPNLNSHPHHEHIVVNNWNDIRTLLS